MQQTFQQSWQLLSTSLKILMKNKRLLFYPAIYGVLCLLIILTFALPSIGLWQNTHLLSAQVSLPAAFSVSWFLLLIGCYFLCNVLLLSCRAAIISYVSLYLQGQRPRLMLSLQIACQHFAALAVWSLINSTLGLVLRTLENHSGLRNFVGNLLGATWTFITFLALPAMIIDQHAPIAAISESITLSKKSWGQELIGLLSINVLYYLFYYPAYAILLLSLIFLHNNAMLLGLSLGGALLLLGNLVDSVLHGIYQTVLFQYAQTGTLPSRAEADATIFANDIVQRP